MQQGVPFRKSIVRLFSHGLHPLLSKYYFMRRIHSVLSTQWFHELVQNYFSASFAISPASNARL